MRQFCVATVDGIKHIVERCPWPYSCHEAVKAILTSLSDLRQSIIDYNPGYSEQGDGSFVEHSWESGCSLIEVQDEVETWEAGVDYEVPRIPRHDPRVGRHCIYPEHRVVDDLAVEPKLPPGIILPEGHVEEEPFSTLRYDLWLEGYSATGDSSAAQYLGAYYAASLPDAFRQWVDEKPQEREPYAKFLDNGMCSFWACRVFDDEEAARRAYG